jgi:hypothetical protein
MRLAAAALFALAVTACASTGSRGGPEDAARFEKLKSLAGTWTADGSADAPAGTQVVYRVTGAGSAVQEQLFCGQPHEMITVYTMDKGRLVMTHYCAIGNQPHMEAQPGGDPDTVKFVCTSIGNGSMSDMHMHQGEITFVDPDHVRSAWTLWANGAPNEVKKFSLTRTN